jgi:precorrin-6B C5,15-methyltransferase / cobalt-precorrin-6B C5,C15-methyltransferase
MSTKTWLTIVGIGMNGLDGLTPEQHQAIDGADILAGGKRHLDMIPKNGKERFQWGAPFIESLEKVLTYKGRKVTVLATGDPMWFGIGATLSHRVGKDEMRVLPAPSAFSLAAARMAWPIADIECLSAHGRPIEALIPFFTPGAKLLILTANGDAPKDIATLLADRGFGQSRFTVLGNLGADDEIKIDSTAAEWGNQNAPDLNTVAVICMAGPNAKILPRTAGLPDDAFIHDGQLTKREVRAVTLSALQPLPGQLLWDVGAGCGSVSIEWMRSARNARAISIEKNSKRRDMIENNALGLGTPSLEIIAGTAPDAIADLEPPDAVFIGGGLTTENVLASCWQALKSGGRIVANAVTLESEAILIDAQHNYGGELIKISIDRTSEVGSFNRWKPLAPVTQWQAIKP